MVIMNISSIKYLLHKYGKLEITVEGNCMNPIIENSDKVLIKENDNYQIGDIVLVAYANKILIHRIVDIKNGRIKTKGDHSYLCDKNAGSFIIGKAEMNITKNIILRTTYISKIKGKLSYIESVIYRNILKSRNKYIKKLYIYLYKII